MKLTLSIYSLVMRALQPWLVRKLKRRAQQEPLYALAMDERFGVYTSQPWVAVGRTVWVHAVSLGETRAAALLVQALRALMPEMRLLLTHSTATGRQEGQSLLQAGDAQVWLPWDTPAATHAFLVHHQPAIGILLETEIWPNLIDQAKRFGVPVVLANARMSDKSLQQALRLKWLAMPAFASLQAVLAQTDEDAQRLQQLGAPVVGVLGNMKFDAVPDESQLLQGRRWRELSGRPVVLLASSREGEEAAWLTAVQALSNRVQWLVVPRHPQRFEEVAALITQAGLSVSRRQSWTDQPMAAQVWLGDSMGEMALYYSLSDVALLGGSFEPLGGQNLIEAAACGCPVIMGPHTFNFTQAAELALQAGAALRCQDMAHAVQTAVDLVGSADLTEMQAAAVRFASSHRGAVGHTAQIIQGILKKTT
jgi:3-deoxy-D-manno-octulosonic-acid transferase